MTLQDIGERIEQLGGTMSMRRDRGVWTVRVRVPIALELRTFTDEGPDLTTTVTAALSQAAKAANAHE